MKNLTKGNAMPSLIALLALSIIVAGTYIYITNNFNNDEQTAAVNNTTSAKSIDLWTIFDKSNLALKNSDVSSFNTYSYEQVSPAEIEQFTKFSPKLYEASAKINKADYVNKWQDAQQAIYSTNIKKTENAEAYDYSRASISFIKENGQWKVLENNLQQQWSILKSGTNKTAAQIEKEMKATLLDSDKDGITDEKEKCEGDQKYNPKCIKTNPLKRDTNGNGWWDGIESKMK